MYADYSPYPNSPRGVKRVLVLEGGETADEVIREARFVGSTSEDCDGKETFWIIFPDEPKRLWDFTERSLRCELR